MLELMDAESNLAKVGTERAQTANHYVQSLAELLQACGGQSEEARALPGPGRYFDPDRHHHHTAMNRSPSSLRRMPWALLVVAALCWSLCSGLSGGASQPPVPSFQGQMEARGNRCRTQGDRPYRPCGRKRRPAGPGRVSCCGNRLPRGTRQAGTGPGCAGSRPGRGRQGP